MTTKDFYTERIGSLVRQCDDCDLLDLVSKLLEREQTTPKEPKKIERHVRGGGIIAAPGYFGIKAVAK